MGLSEIVGAEADQWREQYHYSFGRSDEWYVVLPSWLVHQGGKTAEQFAVQWEESVKRMAGLPLGNLVGFETDAPGGGIYRYTATWHNGGSSETPEEETK